MLSEFCLRTNIDFSEIRERLRCEHGSAVQSEAKTSAALTDIQKDLDDCDAQVRRLQSHIIFLQNLRQDLKAYETCLRSLRSPIRKLPNETMLDIIDYACDMNEVTSEDLSAMPALSISGVCSHWRGLVRSSPSSWARMRLYLFAAAPKLQTFPIVTLYLTLSQTSPLALELEGETSGDMMPHHHTVCDALIACSDRWQYLFVYHHKILSVIMRDGLHFPTLEQVAFPQLPLGLTTLNSYKQASNLQSLSLSRVSDFDSSRSEFPWMQLTSLDIAQCGNGIRDLFERCTNLKDLRFRQFQNGAVEYCTPAITVSSVQSLELLLSAAQLADVVFSSFTCPSLTSLHIEGTKKYNHNWPRNEISSFLSRSSCHLTTLSLESVPLLDSDLIDLLHQLPFLLHLAVHDPHEHVPGYTSPITTQFVQSLHPFHHANSDMVVWSALVRNLQSLSLTLRGSDIDDFDDQPFVDFDDRIFVDMVSSRWLPESYAGYGLINSNPTSTSRTACLRSVVVRFTNRVVDEDIYKPLRYLEGEGMRIVIVGRGS